MRSWRLLRSTEFNILVAVDLKAHDIEQDVVRLAEQHEVLDRLLFIGRTITESDVRNQVRRASVTAQTAAVANDADEFPSALAVSNADWVYVRYLPSREQMEAVRGAGRRSFIAGSTVSGKLPDDWRHAMEVGVDAILTDYPLELRPVCRRVSGEE